MPDNITENNILGADKIGGGWRADFQVKRDRDVQKAAENVKVGERIKARLLKLKQDDSKQVQLKQEANKLSGAIDETPLEEVIPSAHQIRGLFNQLKDMSDKIAEGGFADYNVAVTEYLDLAQRQAGFVSSRIDGWDKSATPDQWNKMNSYLGNIGKSEDIKDKYVLDYARAGEIGKSIPYKKPNGEPYGVDFDKSFGHAKGEISDLSKVYGEIERIISDNGNQSIASS